MHSEREARIEASVEGGEATCRLVSAPESDLVPELQVDPERALGLEALAAATGGKYLPLEQVQDLVIPASGGSRPVGILRLWPLCLRLALVGYLGERLSRRR